MKREPPIKRPKTKTAKCAHCGRRRYAKFIEWHPGIGEWQCSNFADCDRARGLVWKGKP